MKITDRRGDPSEDPIIAARTSHQHPRPHLTTRSKPFDTSINDASRVAVKAELDEEFDFDEGLFSGHGGPMRTHYLASTSRLRAADRSLLATPGKLGRA